MRFTLGGDHPLEAALLRAAEQTGEFSVAALRSLSPLPRDSQVLIDRAVLNVGLQRLTVAADIMAANLTYPLTDPLSVTEIEWESISKTGGAQRTMNPSARGERQMPNRTQKRLPVYLTTDDFSLGIRTIKMSQRVGVPLDTTLVEQATRRVNEAIEDATINGSGVQFDGYVAPGLLNAPNANTYTIPIAWTAATGEQIYADVMTIIGKLQVDLKYGPYNFYLGTAYSNALFADFKANGDKSILSRLQEIQAGGRAIQFKTADMFPPTTVAAVQMTSDTLDMVVGQQPTVIPWTSIDGFTLFWMVMAILVPRIKSDYDGNSGIVIAS